MKSEKNTGLTIVQPRVGVSGGSFLGHLWAAIGVTLVLGIICCGIYPLIIYGLSQTFLRVQADGSLLAKDGSYTTDDQNAVGSALIGQAFSSPGYFHPRFSAAGAGYDATSSGSSNLGPLSDKLINGLNNPATTQPTTQPESNAYDGIRMRTIQYATDNNIRFNLYNETVAVDSDNNVTYINKTPAKIDKYLNKDGSLNYVAFVDDFPHPTPTGDVTTPGRVVVIAADFSELIPGDAVTGSGSGLDPHISPENARLQAARVAGARNVSVDQVKALIDQYTDKPSLGFLGDPGVNVLRLNLSLDAKYPIPAPTPPPAPQPAAAPATQPAVAPTTQPSH